MCIFPALLSPIDTKVYLREDEGTQLSDGGTRNALLKGTGRGFFEYHEYYDRLGLNAFKASCQIFLWLCLLFGSPLMPCQPN